MYNVDKLIQYITPHIRAAMDEAYGHQNTWMIPSNPSMHHPMHYNDPYYAKDFLQQLNIGMCNHHYMDGTSAVVVDYNTATCSLCGKTWECISKESENYIRLVWDIINDAALAKQPKMIVGSRTNAGNAYATLLKYTNDNTPQTLKMLVDARINGSYENDNIIIISIDDGFIITLKNI